MSATAMRWASGLILGVLFPVSASGYDPIHDDGYECRVWYLDADGDGFGAPGSGVPSCAPAPGRVIRADDCDDGNPAIHPLALDRPDPLYVDANCDGSDGDPARAIHVATAGSDGSGCGDRAAPCRTLAFALGRRSAARPDLYVQQGTYAGAIHVGPGPGPECGIYGGFRADWTRAPGSPAVIEGAASALADQNVLGLFIDGGTVRLGSLRVASPAAAGNHGDGSGRGAYALVLRNAAVTGFDLRLEAGAGAAGASGPGGGSPPAAAADGASGGNATTITCSTLPGGLGGAAATNTCGGGSRNPNGGAGGRGGAADTNCDPFAFNPVAQPGQSGSDAAFVLGASGGGGAGGTGSFLCGVPADGAAGAPGPAGSAGPGGAGGSIAGMTARWWRAASGGTGGIGDHGGGGGGGGGSGGCDSPTPVNARGAGGGGGGAGGCRAAVAGQGGRGGGPSVAVFMDLSTLDLTGSTLVTAAGGRGGDGGAGTPGQPGGAGGPGGLAPGGTSDGKAGGAGGPGGRGGASGGGGGGAGGLSVGILRLGGALTQSGNTFLLGAAGVGGAGGAAPDTPGGAAGTPGAQQQVLVCASATNC